MKDFLPAALADKALPEIKKVLSQRWRRSQDPTTLKRSTSKHKTSEYILTGLLFAKQDGGLLTGVLCGRVGKKTRRYRHRRGRVGYQKGSIFNRTFHAPSLEKACLDLVGGIIGEAPNLRQRILAAIEAQAPSAETEQELAALRAQREKITERVQYIVRNFDADMLADAKPELDRLGAQGRELDRQISELEGAQHYSGESLTELADRAIERIGSLKDDLANLSPIAQRELLEAFIEGVEVDMETRNAKVSLRLPPWAFENGDLPMRLANSSPWSTVDETHQGEAAQGPTILLAYGDCRYEHVRGSTTVPPCYRCRRRAA